MKRNLYVSAIYTSPPGTMGGNTKILLELINNLNNFYNFVIFTSEPEAFIKNIKNLNSITLIEIPYNFRKFNYASHLKEISYVYDFYKQYFSINKIEKNDYFYSASEAAPDVLPIYKLKKKYDFQWIASLYLFIPNPFENLIKKYNFPFFKYLIYLFYQRYLFRKILKKFDLCLITNDIDKKRFPQKKHNKILAMYGGVNFEQINHARNNFLEKKYDAVFCSRLHPQKGIAQLLDIWKIVIKKIPNANLAIIGNGDSKYKKYLKQKADRLLMRKNLTWLGYVNGVKKYRIYLQSKIFLHSTIYDNNGMVATEALCSGLPVVMYDLEAFKKIYNFGCIKIKEGKKKDYAQTILDLLKDKNYYNKIKPKKADIQTLKHKWSWQNRAKIFKNFIEQHESKNKL